MPADTSFGSASQYQHFQPQFDWGSLVGPIVHSVLDALSTSPQSQTLFQPQAAAPGQLQPQFNWGALVGPIVSSVLKSLSSSPQLAQAMQPQSAAPPQIQPQFDFGSLSKPIAMNGFGNPFSSYTPLSSSPPGLNPQSAGAGQLQPQFDWGSLVSTIVPIVMSALSAQPQLAQTLQAQSAGPGQLQPQFNWGSLVSTIVPIVLSALSAQPQLAQALQTQSAQPQYTQAIRPLAAGPGSLQPQFDWGSLVSTIVPIVMSALTASPQFLQAAQQQTVH